MILALVAYGCRRAPGYVLGKEDMAQVMADMYVGEIVVDMNHQDYNNDSAKQLLKQSILARHGFTQQDFDTSLIWYGHNIDKYVDVHNRVIDILEKRNRDLGNAIVQEAVSLSGDSVDVWVGARYARVNERMPSKMVYFDLPADENMEPGDLYTWRIKMLGADSRQIKWGIYANYADSTCEWMYTTTSMRDWNEVTFASDSTREITALRGFFEITPRGRNLEPEAIDVWVDSISLVRKRSNPDVARFRSRVHSSKNF